MSTGTVLNFGFDFRVLHVAIDNYRWILIDFSERIVNILPVAFFASFIFFVLRQ